MADAPESLRILIVDDEPILLGVLARLFSRHTVTTRERVAEAVALIESGASFDVILSDLMMPERTGAEFYDEILRSHPALARRFVFITGGPSTEAAVAFVRRVPQPVVTKPFDRVALRELVERVGRGEAV